MSRFKASTHQLIDEHIKEIMRPKIIVGATYKFREYKDGATVERKVISVNDKTVTYQKPSGKAKCSVSTFQRLYEIHGVGTPIKPQEEAQ
ncbi:MULTISPECIES: hypothetical protein [Paenibacillus]|uniref:Uncharacterized protein n=1 Tax=Paenibacillus odorifer TaxID=189426 RepID=A0AB36J3F7_9BACL|nr:hypothetical protein [Paenibacillus odorifer]OMD08381.1 hypothetical protein BJP50_07260 [Paenibacillus odorifer]OME11056.1 hypothetical protein BSK47_29555 [Paenibacillus odorifer]